MVELLLPVAALLPLAVTHQRRIVRAEGILLLSAYIGYVVWLIMRN